MITLVQKLYLRFRTIWHYGLIAGIGWTIDTGILYTLAQILKFPVFPSSIAGLLCGACFNYFVSAHIIFDSGKNFCWRKLGIYIGYILITMVIWSALLTFLVHIGLWIIAAKIAIIPFSFYMNFLFMGWLQEGRVRWH